MTVTYIMGLAGFILAIVAKLPWIGPRFDALSKDIKRLIMLGVIVLIGVVLLVVACVNFGIDIGSLIGSPLKTCDETSVRQLFGALVGSIALSLGVNQFTHWITDKALEKFVK